MEASMHVKINDEEEEAMLDVLLNLKNHML